MKFKWPWQKVVEKALENIEIVDDREDYNIGMIRDERRRAEYKLRVTAHNGDVVGRVSKEARRIRVQDDFGLRLTEAFGRARDG